MPLTNVVLMSSATHRLLNLGFFVHTQLGIKTAIQWAIVADLHRIHSISNLLVRQKPFDSRNVVLRDK